MWTTAFVLLGLVVLCALAGFHLGPHAHGVGAILGLVAAGWLVVMAIDGRATPLLWTLFASDLVISGGIGTIAWKGLKTPDRKWLLSGSNALEGATGTVVTELSPDGTVRVNGENWSATSQNGNVPAGANVQVIRVVGVHLEVWGEDSDSLQCDSFEINGVARNAKEPRGDAPDSRKAAS